MDRTSGVLRPQILVGGEAMLLQLMKLWWIDFQARNGLLSDDGTRILSKSSLLSIAFLLNCCVISIYLRWGLHSENLSETETPVRGGRLP